MLLRSTEEGGGHVHAELAQLLGPAVRDEVLAETLEGAGVLARCREEQLRALEVAEERGVVVAAAAAGFIHPEMAHLREVLPGAGPLDVEVHDPPDASVVLADQVGDRAHRHLRGEGHDEALEEVAEARPRSGPGNLDLPHAVALAADPWYARVQVRPVLEEVEVAPLLHLAVMHRAAGGAAVRAGEPRATVEVEVQVELTLR